MALYEDLQEIYRTQGIPYKEFANWLSPIVASEWGCDSNNITFAWFEDDPNEHLRIKGNLIKEYPFSAFARWGDGLRYMQSNIDCYFLFPVRILIHFGHGRKVIAAKFRVKKLSKLKFKISHDFMKPVIVKQYNNKSAQKFAKEAASSFTKLTDINNLKTLQRFNLLEHINSHPITSMIIAGIGVILTGLITNMLFHFIEPRI